ncbi:MAG: hypothetical protein QNJ40_18020 [Xanthomonadales bacterium]|nr:hypothetical protein [Xanthomonadales bacterium]
MATKKTDADGTDTHPDNVDQIREIIFGGYIRDYESRFVALEKKLADAQDKLRKDFDKRLKALEDDLNKESRDRMDGDESLDALLQNQGSGLGEDIEAAEKRLDQRLANLHETLEQASQSITDLLNKETTALNRELDKVTTRLSDQKVARIELAKLLDHVSQKLNPPSGSAKKSR